MRFGSKICKTLLKDTGMTMRILNMITFSVIVIPQPQQQLRDSSITQKWRRVGDSGGGEGGRSEWKEEPKRRTPCHYYNRVVYPWVIFYSATALEIKWTFPRTRPHTHTTAEFFWDFVIAGGFHAHIPTFKLIVQLVHAGQGRSSGDM